MAVLYFTQEFSHPLSVNLGAITLRDLQRSIRIAAPTRLIALQLLDKVNDSPCVSSI
jgi:hypothetical protein